MENSNQRMAIGSYFRNAFAFLMIGLPRILFGTIAGRSGVPLIWLGATMLAVGANYAFPQQFVLFRKSSGKLELVRKLLLFPYIGMFHGLWHVLRKVSSQAPFV